ncbi:hypothetical protein LEP1GSC060_1282 [Leptospira weilii serovar Ranarum str. ICFT]|uniref:Uncharacterized protein n=1 Tax=Leptospira weilii serovar Ranarum str. ICFT TaxID=1218598 RepID=N1WUP3_9LEPT|nr:hypothetical protein LEP1GSC060_1282 [Leptospira weilii serovar Ranarum str. ICFT]
MGVFLGSSKIIFIYKSKIQIGSVSMRAFKKTEYSIFR